MLNGLRCRQRHQHS